MNHNMHASRRRLQIALAVVAVLAITACGAGTDNDPTGQAWELSELEGAAPVDGTTIDITITEDGVSGSSGCNNYTASADLSVDSSSLELTSEIASTMMACEESIMEQEQRFLNALSTVSGYEMASDELILEDAQGIAFATFSR